MSITYTAERNVQLANNPSGRSVISFDDKSLWKGNFVDEYASPII